MKAIIPLAGKGTRLRPLTHHTPKPLLKVAGRPVLGYLLDDLVAVGVDELILIVGYLRDVIHDYLDAAYPDLRARYVVQDVQDGTAGAVKLAEPYVDDEVLIVFADALFDADLSVVSSLDPAYGGIIWAKEVEDYQRFGVIVTDKDGAMRRIVEKPSEPVSRLANIGVYHMRDWRLLFEGVNHTLASAPGPSGEFYLTDAFQYMVDHGCRILTAPVEGWYDCGKVETLLETNRHLLETGRAGVDDDATVDGVRIVQPVRVEAGAVVRGGTLGPNVTVETGARITDSGLRDAVIGAGAEVRACRLHGSLVGGHARLVGVEGVVSLADHSVVEAT